jgi:predicted nucleic acid-binding protein
LPLGTDVARRFSQLFVALRAAGTPVGTNDIWIGAAALDTGAHVVTFDGDFRKLTGVDCTVLDG